MSDLNKNTQIYNYLPIFIGVIVFFIFTLGALFLFLNSNAAYLNIEKASPWIVLVLGLLIAILVGIIIRLNQSNKLTHFSLKEMTETSNQEMLKLLQAEESKQNLEKALLQGQKLQAIGTLAGGIAHDFNNILYAIKGYIAMAREDLDTKSIIHRNLGKVLEAADRGQELIARILAFSRRQHVDYEPIYLQTTIENALALLRPTIPASVNIEFESFGDECVVTGNQTQLHQVIVNIVNNAVDSMDGEGVIKVKLNYLPPDDDLNEQLSKENGSHFCRIDISDSGCGMDQSTMARIFEPFYTTKEVGKGTGLGLSTVYSIVSNHQGLITVNSKLGEGTIFTIVLPMLTVPAENNYEK